MVRNMAVCLAALTALMAFECPAQAQIHVRAPFVEVDVDGGVRVRAPFVNLWIPGRAPVMVQRVPVGQPGQPVFQPGQPFAEPGQPLLQPVQPAAPVAVAPATADPVSDELPAPRKEVKGAFGVQEFSKIFRPREGIHEVTVINPVTKMPTSVRFALPNGTPERVVADDRKIEFIYGPRSFVRIEFDEGGALVTSR